MPSDPTPSVPVSMLRTCAQAGCNENAECLVIESHALAMLFKSGAGFVCEKHAAGLCGVGGVKISLLALVEAAERSERLR